LGLPSELGSL
jgi:serine-aspartate repeat-containing protein C/D/E